MKILLIKNLLLEQYSNILIKKGEPIKENLSEDMKRIKHEVQLKEDAVPQPGSAFPMDEAVKGIFYKWHDQMVQNGQIRKATKEECKHAMFILSHFAILKRDAVAPYGPDSYRFVLNCPPYNKHIKANCKVHYPTMDNIKATIKGKKIFSVIDLKSFFWMIPAHYPRLVHLCKGEYYKYDVTHTNCEDFLHPLIEE